VRTGLLSLATCIAHFALAARLPTAYGALQWLQLRRLEWADFDPDTVASYCLACGFELLLASVCLLLCALSRARARRPVAPETARRRSRQVLWWLLATRSAEPHRTVLLPTCPSCERCCCKLPARHSSCCCARARDHKCL
jgi:hypothetical protein